ncbi:MAG: PKHD-type hydroxylase, partial [Alphaproteobacteria bacterium]|nr:PKHD-type hydroxylase [Alphaproteobacteria bacterium]
MSAFVDGMQSGGAYVRNFKNNREISAESEQARELDATVQAALAASNDFQIVAMPWKISPFLFSSYSLGQFYGDHADSAVMGRRAGDPFRADLSMTIFLDEPADYDGGELV